MGFDELIQRHKPGFGLAQEFYRDPAVFQRDIARVHMRHWLCVGHVSRIPKPGDYFVYDIADESFIIVRDRAGEIRALANVCRHRGSQVCYEKEGSSKAFVCPYHGWTYDLDGSLRNARLSGAEVDKSQYGLARLHLRIIEGLILICCADEPPDLAEAERLLGSALGHYGWAKAKVVHRARYSVDANWKLTTENYMECYHCAPAHPEFSRFHSTAKPFEETEALRAAAEENHLEVVKLLIAKGANLSLQEANGPYTPLSRAGYREHWDIVKLLIKHGAGCPPVEIVGEWLFKECTKRKN